jgi:hypothetical protein
VKLLYFEHTIIIGKNHWYTLIIPANFVLCESYTAKLNGSYGNLLANKGCHLI